MSLRKKLTYSIAFTFLAIFLVYFFLFSHIPWNLITLDTAIAGGDTGSHNYILYNLKQNFPTIKTWSHDWYGGFPFLYFYPPLLFVFSVVLSFFIKLNVAFKITTLLGTFILPLCAFLCLKFLKFKKPIPEIGLLAGLAYVFCEAFSIYGGNLPSTMAGEFSYSFSFSLFFLFIGLFTKGLEENKYLLWNILILATMVLSHPFPVIGAVIYAFFAVFLGSNIKQRIFYTLKTFVFAFLLTGFWSIPFLYYHEFTSTMNWYKTVELKDIFPQTRLFVFLQYSAILGLFFGLIKRLKSVLFLIVAMLANFALYMYIDNSPIYNARFLPFVIVFYLLIGSVGIGFLLLEMFKNKKHLYIASILFILWGLVTINPSVILGPNTKMKGDLKYIHHWLQWNYSGFESKDPFLKDIVPLNRYLSSLPEGKIMWEYRGEYDKYGTPRFLENLPIWTGKPTFEGLLIESSIFGPFHFINQTETTKTPTSAIAGFEYPPFDFEKGIEHLKLVNASYFVAYTPEIKSIAKEYLTTLRDFKNFSVYKIADDSPVSVVADFDVIKKEKGWIKTSIDWYKNGDLSKPIVFYRNQQQLEVLANAYTKKEISGEIKIIESTDTKLVFETNDINALHIIKTSYFPKWKYKTTNDAFIVSPVFIGVIPKNNVVEINFSNNTVDDIAYILSILMLMLIVYKIVYKQRLPWL